MPDSESFDAFYARTVWNVTSQMHALADGDGAADHAIREAYAKAYQQWYEVSSHQDTEGWVLAVAKDAYQRRRPEATPRLAEAARAGHDSLSWPGLYRPAPPPSGSAPDPAATIGGPIGRVAAGPTLDIAGPLAAGTAGGPAAGTAAEPAGGGIGLVSPPANGALAPTRLRPGGTGRPARFGSRHLVALAAVIALVVAGGLVYLATARHPATRAGSHPAAQKSHKSVVRMLGAGRTGTRSQIPWSLIGQGWTLAEVSTAQATTGVAPESGGTITTYLVDPRGGRYQIQSSSPGVAPQLLAWSGDARKALFAVPGNSPSGATYELLSLTTGNLTVLPLPANVTAVGFTRPDGLNIIAVRQTSTAYRLQRYNLQGAFQAVIGSLPRKHGSPNWQPQACGVACNALSSPAGLTAVWGVTGDEMQLVRNTGGLIRRLHVPGSGSPPSCVPLTWWNSSTVLASCAAPDSVSRRLWLVPADGTSPTALTGPSGSISGSGVLTGVWRVAGSTYVNVTDFRQCPAAPSGPGGLAVVPVSSGGSLQQPVTVQGTTSNHTSIVSTLGGRLLVLAQTSCPGTSSLLWLNPSTGATTTVRGGGRGPGRRGGGGRVRLRTERDGLTAAPARYGGTGPPMRQYSPPARSRNCSSTR